jgi:alkylhydroperoxidase family enzyme
MIKSLMHRYLGRFEREWGYDASYMHDVVDASPAGARKFAFLQPMAQHRQDVSKDAWHAAHLAGALSEDCGPCVQLCVDMATRDGMDPGRLAALIRGDIDAAGSDAALGFRYGMAISTGADTALALVEQARKRFGERGLVSLAFSVTTARMFPTLKRALGHGVACSRVLVSDQAIAVKHAA